MLPTGRENSGHGGAGHPGDRQGTWARASTTPRLDTLFLTLPVSWRGTIAHMPVGCTACNDGKREVRVYDYADLNVPMLARMFDRRCRGYEAVGYTILLPASAIPGWPVNVPLPSDPALEARLFGERAQTRSGWRGHSAGPVSSCAPPVRCHPMPMASIAHEARRRHSSIGAWKPYLKQRAVFVFNAALPIAFDGFGTLEVDLLCDEARVAVELDGAQHLADPVAYRRDRRKDQLLQERGYFVLRFLAEDVSKELGAVLDAIVRSLSHRDRQPSIARVQAVGISTPGRP